MEKKFSTNHRLEFLEEMESKELDVLIIGGGITGAGIALDAVSRGLTTGLVEMQDFAAGTSSRSTKLVHGGLRYLKQLEVKLVAEVGKERAIVYENAPHVTTPEWMLLPMIQGGTFGKFSTSLGLRVYDFLAGVRKKERRRMLTREETLAKEPLLRKEGLKGGGVYVEYKTDDARLTLEILKEAVNRGVTAVNYAKAENFIYENGKVCGVTVKDIINDRVFSIRAKKIVNATGPWVDTLREEDRSKKGKSLYLTKGIHIVVDQSRFPLRQAVYFDTKDDGRMIFAIPRDGKAYIGTTDTHYVGDIQNPRMTEEDLNYLIDTANYMFPEVNLTEEDVESNWAGLRPLIHEEGKRASEISRKDEVFLSPSGLISIAGGKLTGYRKMAEKVVNHICKDLNIAKPCVTEKMTLSGGDVGGSSGLEQYIADKTKEGMTLGLEEEAARKLVKLYGSNIDNVYNIITARGPEEAKKYKLPLDLFASLLYGIEEEMAATPIDFFNRRTGSLFFNIHSVQLHKDSVLRLMAEKLGWSVTQKEVYREELERELLYAANPSKRAESLESRKKMEPVVQLGKGKL